MFKTAEEIIAFAIKNEEAAARFYTDMAERTEVKHMKQAFLDFAEEEKGHKAKLVAVQSGNMSLPPQQKVQDLKIGDHTSDVTLSSGLNYQQALIVAMKAEKAAFQLYNALATATDDADLKNILLSLAQEEAKHKLRFEIEYDENFLQEN